MIYYNNILGTNAGETLNGTDYSDQLLGLGGNDFLYGGLGDDLLDGGPGRDRLFGGDGNDILRSMGDGDAVGEIYDGGAGFDTFYIRYDSPGAIRNIDLAAGRFYDGSATVLGTVSGIELVAFHDYAGTVTVNGSSGNDTMAVLAAGFSITAGAGDDVISVTSGTATIDGGTGRDTLALFWMGDPDPNNFTGYSVSLARVGIAQKVAKDYTGRLATLTLSGIENLLGSIRNDRLVGDSADNVLTGHLGDDILIGGAGNDRLFGGEGPVSPIDTWEGGVVQTYDNNAIDKDVLEGGTGNDQIDGGKGFDIATYEHARTAVTVDLATGTATGGDGSDTLTGIEGVIGSVGNDTLKGNAEANWFDGGLGADTMTGGKGDDTYVIDSLADTIVELADGGSDTVAAAFSLTVSGEIENATLLGTANLDATGNDRANVLTGNAGINHLAGGAGDDTYVVQNSDDIVDEASANGGHDTVRSSVSWTLGANLEDLVLFGTAQASATGNALDNVIVGNEADNIIDGGLGADVMYGGLGNDHFIVDNIGDVVIDAGPTGPESPGYGDWDTVFASISYTLGGSIEKLTLTGDAAINGTGNWKANTIVGNGADNVIDGGGDGSNNDILAGGGGNDTLISRGYSDWLYGGEGNDTYVINRWAFGGHILTDETADSGIDTIVSYGSGTLAEFIENFATQAGQAATAAQGNALNNLMTGGDLADGLFGGDGNDTLRGGGGDDRLYGGAGNDVMEGGAGNDTYLVDDIGDVVIEKASGGTDTISTKIDNYTLGDNLENLTLYDGLTGTGNALNNVITGTNGNETLDGGAGDDTLAGGNGDDRYYVDTLADKVDERLTTGFDTIYASLDYSLAKIANVEGLVLTGTARRGWGNSLANTIVGNELNNILYGDRGDVLQGGLGNDTFQLKSTDVVVKENAGEGNDLVVVGGSYGLTANVERLTLTGTGDFSGGGNELANIIVGNSGNNTLYGLAGKDRLTGNDGADTLFGGADRDSLYGGNGNDILDGGAGADQMNGGLGDDTYYVESTGDAVVESNGGGIDQVFADVDYVLAEWVENLTVSGSYHGTGNELANTIVGGGGNNILDGRGGADLMQGMNGDDTYYVDTAGDQVLETIGAGRDTVIAMASYALGAGQEIETLELTGLNALSGTGNELGNHIIGNDAANLLNGAGGADRLDGNGGADTLIGGAGNDVLDGGIGADSMDGGLGDDGYYVDNTGDTVSEATGDGLDLVATTTSITLGAGIEGGVVRNGFAASIKGNAEANALGGNSGNDTLDGGDGDDVIFGGGGQDTLLGGAGADVLVGGGQYDRLTGGTGADTFIVITDGSVSTPTQITDFVSGTDRIVVLNPFLSGQLLPAGFVQGTSARDGNDIAIYDKGSGQLWADIDGNGAGAKVLVATFTPGTSISASDIQLIEQSSLDAQIGDVAGWLYGTLDL
ncbi:beta strand repeat-containing protein [Novosphingobium cyanobacteriorum]|uniref:Calcium-binding protein n=1 Tax=Novosphingobium cyanobacteriorum TaxID=3024215 RepID=A0ABT6CFA8_9SPHN|nr:calcium-binding protein [Novosphingobium cyanobacteriorum]MDF8332591.1 calcium-binding protein [Novosphingobium cyanobacteriorum]